MKTPKVVAMNRFNRTSEATVKKMAEALESVLRQGWGGYWPFIQPCQEALDAYTKEHPTVCVKCGKPAILKIVTNDGQEVFCSRCFPRMKGER